MLKELEKELIAAGSSMKKVLKVNVYLNDIADYKGMNEVYKGRFGDKPPVRTTVAVAKGGVPGDSLVENRLHRLQINDPVPIRPGISRSVIHYALLTKFPGMRIRLCYFSRQIFIASIFVFFYSCNDSRDKEVNGGLILPGGFEATVVIDSIGSARHMAVNDNGDIYINSGRLMKMVLMLPCATTIMTARPMSSRNSVFILTRPVMVLPCASTRVICTTAAVV